LEFETDIADHDNPACLMWPPFLKKLLCKKKPVFELLPNQWALLPLGNPGDEYALTRHNLGRLMLQRWMDKLTEASAQIHRLHYGAIYSLNDSFVALVPSTYMNLSGHALREAMKNGLPLSRALVIYDDKDLPLGTGRLSLSGGPGGHKGVQGLIEGAGSEDFARLRLGIGPFARPLREWVLGEWAPGDWAAIEQMDTPFGEFLSRLAKGVPLPDLQSQVNGRAFWSKDPRI
jgi:PTH1 family peptidyl-tRNA hydrolase